MELQVSQAQLEPQAQGASSAPARYRGRVQGAVNANRKYGTVVLLVFIIVGFTVTTSDFLTLSNFQSILVIQTVTACMTFGVMFPLIVGEFDLSVGYMIGFVCMLGAYLSGKGWGPVPVMIAMVVSGALVGLANAVLIERAKISSFIATLGVGIVLEGITQGLSGGSVLTNNIAPVFATIGRSNAGPLAVSVWITIVLAGVLFYVFEHTPFGRSLYAIGGSQRVAFLAGLRTRRLKTAAFALSGVMVAIGAIFALGQNGSASPGFGPDLLLPAYAAAFLGVTTFRGGYYNVVGSVVGILVLAIGFNGLSLLGVAFWVQPIFNGGVLLVAVLAARAETRSVRVGS
jgi:ribose transport system permease protein